MTDPHEALGVFIGHWQASGMSYGGDGQTPDNPHAGAVPWRSIHTAVWHSGGFFVVQDERANGPFDTLTLLGWDRDAGRYFARSIENHGFARDYRVVVDGSAWTLTGEHERATITFSDDGGTQSHSWEWRPNGDWLPLCERTAVRVS